MPSLRINGEDLYYEIAGDGPALILVHSLGTGRWLWREQVRHWSSAHRVVAADCRGHGATTFRGGAAMEDTARDLAALADELALRDVVIVGLSMGGVIASHLQSLLQDRARGLVLAGTFCRVPSGQDRIAGIERKLQEHDMATFGRAYAAETLLPPALAAHGEELASSIACTSKEAYLATVRSLFMQDTRSLLSAMQCPVEVIVGEHDQRTPRALAEEIAATAPRAQLDVIPSAAHLSNLDQPAAFASIVDNFIAALPR
jgi:3-oxoadipate enol-lactonase